MTRVFHSHPRAIFCKLQKQIIASQPCRCCIKETSPTPTPQIAAGIIIRALSSVRGCFTSCAIYDIKGVKRTTFSVTQTQCLGGLCSSGCWSTARHAVVLTPMKEHYYRAHCVYHSVYALLCQLMYWRMLLIYTKQLPISGLWVHDV